MMALKFTASFCLILSASGFIDDLPSGYTYLSSTRAFYKLHTEPVTWGDAASTCRSEGARLFHPDSDEELELVWGWLVVDHIGVLNGYSGFFTGLSDVETPGEFKTVDGRLLSQVYNKWQLEEPTSGRNNESRCGVLHPFTRTPLLYVDRCNWRRAFTCKHEALPPVIKEGPEDLVKVDGSEAVLKCRVTGAPKPVVSWVRTQGSGRINITGGKYNVTPEGDLVIREVSFADAGSYECYAKNEVGEVSALGSLTVKNALPSRYTYLSSTRALYKIHKEKATWGEAKFTCRSEGARLFHPDSDEELKVVWGWLVEDHIGPLNGYYGYFFTGLSDVETPGEFKTVDGRLLSQVYNKWGLAEPVYNKWGLAEPANNKWGPAEPVYNKWGPAEPVYNKWGLAEPANNKWGPAEPVYNKWGPAEPVYNKWGLAEPANNKWGPAEPVYNKWGLAEPANNKWGPAEPVYNKWGLAEPANNKWGPAEPVYNKWGPAEPVYNKWGLAEPANNKWGPAEPVYNKWGLAEPANNKWGPAEPVYNKWGLAEPANNKWGPAEPVYNKWGPAEPVYNKWGPAEPRSGRNNESHCGVLYQFTRIGVQVQFSVRKGLYLGSCDWPKPFICKHEALPPVIKEGPEDLVKVDGSEAVLKCRVTGAPKPVVSWVRTQGSGRINITGGNVTPEGDLVIREVSFADAGSYECYAKNEVGEDSALGSLTVKKSNTEPSSSTVRLEVILPIVIILAVVISVVVRYCWIRLIKKNSQEGLQYDFATSQNIMSHYETRALAAANRRLGEEDFVPSLPPRPRHGEPDYDLPNEHVYDYPDLPNEHVYDYPDLPNEPVNDNADLPNEHVYDYPDLPNEPVNDNADLPNEHVYDNADLPNEHVYDYPDLPNEPVNDNADLPNEHVYDYPDLPNEPVNDNADLPNEHVYNNADLPNEHVYDYPDLPNEPVNDNADLPNEPVNDNADLPNSRN